MEYPMSFARKIAMSFPRFSRHGRFRQQTGATLWFVDGLPSGKRLQKAMENPPIFHGKSTISMAIFNSYVKLPEGISYQFL